MPSPHLIQQPVFEWIEIDSRRTLNEEWPHAGNQRVTYRLKFAVDQPSFLMSLNIIIIELNAYNRKPTHNLSTTKTPHIPNLFR